MATSFLSLRRQWPVYLDDYIFGIRFLTSLVTATSFLCGSRCSKKYGFSILIPVPERFEDYILRWLPLHRLCDSRGVHSRHLLLWNPMTTITAEESLTHVAVALTDEEFFSDEAEELEILRCRHLREHYTNYPIGFVYQSPLFNYVGLTYWSIPPFEEYICRLHLLVHQVTYVPGASRSTSLSTTTCPWLSLHFFAAFIYLSTSPPSLLPLRGVHCRGSFSA